eukprot:m.206183 g.206183  ORF g.206183 m.206183 type:complete len:214 (-) comp10708_c0_seq3:7643-8284(-)
MDVNVIPVLVQCIRAAQPASLTSNCLCAALSNLLICTGETIPAHAIRSKAILDCNALPVLFREVEHENTYACDAISNLLYGDDDQIELRAQHVFSPERLDLCCRLLNHSDERQASAMMYIVRGFAVHDTEKFDRSATDRAEMLLKSEIMDIVKRIFSWEGHIFAKTAAAEFLHQLMFWLASRELGLLITILTHDISGLMTRRNILCSASWIWA